MRHWACMEDFLAFRLTRRLKMDYSIGSRTMMMDIERGAWSPEILACAGISENMLPELAPSGTLVGEVTAEAARMTGLKPGTMVFAGGHDHVCGAFASGIFADNVILDSSGTAEEVLTATRDRERLRLLGSKGFNIGRHVYGGLFYTAGGIPASGAAMDWFGGVWPLTEQERRLKVAGAHGMMFLPHLRGSSTPTRDQKSKGAFLGLREYHTGSDFSQAVTEGLCYEFRQVALALLGDEPPQKIVAIGGGTKNREWIQTKADIMQTVIEIPQRYGSDRPRRRPSGRHRGGSVQNARGRGSPDLQIGASRGTRYIKGRTVYAEDSRRTANFSLNCIQSMQCYESTFFQFFKRSKPQACAMEEKDD